MRRRVIIHVVCSYEQGSFLPTCAPKRAKADVDDPRFSSGVVFHEIIDGRGPVVRGVPEASCDAGRKDKRSNLGVVLHEHLHYRHFAASSWEGAKAAWAL